jgi:predicted MFS family arabinose efflux permease
VFFGAGAIGLPFFLLFLTPLLLAALARLDATGRAAAAGPAFFMIGAAIGPFVGGVILSLGDLAALAWMGAGVSLVALLLLVLAKGRTFVQKSSRFVQDA